MDQALAVNTVRGALGRYGLQDSTPIEFVKYRENYVFRICPEGQISYAVRLHRAGYRSDSEVRCELEFLRALKSRGVDVPAVLPTADGDLLCLIEGSDGVTYQIDMLVWAEGAVPLGDILEAFEGTASLRPETFYRLGVLAATFHNEATAIGRIDGFDRQAWDGEGLVGERALWGDPSGIGELTERDVALLNDVKRELKNELNSFGVGVNRYGVIHADFTPENILVRDEECILIDFDDFGEGWHLFDLATLLFFYLPHPKYPEYQRNAFEGYRSARALPEEHLKSWDAMLLARGLTYMGWASSRRGDDAAEFVVSHIVPMVLDMARSYSRVSAGR
ncbi:phosphotransferase enzyme family protein [Arthrobacter sp. B2a2-09]|uniref:phosphotransferase enzyme family protein n=1 Tax=Arthrobacter sp. B2a2-09 TaxID=2952822 RepID=UPI0022CDAF46|nr:phosphotransferase [Arthrobacter sp. B2a2-09]MCZ9880204.1 phosphotransferase [Arthrobacter sp. B2a2-09]